MAKRKTDSRTLNDSKTEWDLMFSKLEKFYQKYGHSYVPPDRRGLERLFDWTVNQKNAKTWLTKIQVAKLESIDIDWGAVSDDDIRWQAMYNELVAFKKTYGHVKVPQDMKGNEKLARWVSVQRRKKTTGQLPAQRVRDLRAVGFLWKEDIVRMREHAWETRYKELVQFKKIHGHLDRLKVKKENYQLGLWIETQLVHMARLSQGRRQKLNAINFRWDKGNIYKERWDEMLKQLRAYKKEHGHTQVKRSQNFKLSVWLQRQKRDRDELSTEQRYQLEALAIKWPHEHFNQVWLSRYRELNEFKSKYGHIRVTRKYPELFEWIQTQKKSKAEGQLKHDREIKLTRLGFLWAGDQEKQDMDRWEAMYKKFQTFKKRKGDRYILLLKTNPTLNKWVDRQLHNKEKLSATKKGKLDKIHFPWNKIELRVTALWEERYKQLVAFKRKYGHCDVSQKDQKYPLLGLWCNVQRQKKLSTEQKGKLDKIGFKWSGEIAQTRWESRLNEYLELKRKGRLHSINAHTPLHSWIYNQRKNIKKMSVERRLKLSRAGII